MSYDLAVFDPAVAPRERVQFLEWFQQQTEWAEPHGYNDPKVSTPAIREWFLEMIKLFPAMNGPFSKRDSREDEASTTDYSVGSCLVYAAFGWSKAEQAHEATFRLAEKYRVGFFNVSSETSDVWLPDPKGSLVLAHSA